MSAPVTRFRQSPALAVAAVVALIGSVPLASYRWYLAPVALVPLAVGVWAWRAGTDVGPDSLVVRALLGRRRIPWTEVAGLAPAGRRVHAVLTDGASVPLPAVRPEDLPRLVAAGGRTP